MRRHDLIYVCSAAWRSLLKRREDLAAEPLVASWVDRGWPLIGRRALPGEDDGLALGLPLPPFAGKKRLGLLMRAEDIVTIASPPSLGSVRETAPSAWRPTLDALCEFAARNFVDARVYGSLAWQVLTGLQYLSETSDLDLILNMYHRASVGDIAAGIAAIETSAPMRIDGEVIRDDGAAVNWREIHAGPREILVKSADGVFLLDVNAFHVTQAAL